MDDWTIIKILSWTESYFKDHSIDSPRLTAEILLAHCLCVKRLDLYLQYDRPLQENERLDFKALIKRRRNHEPVAYITGEKGFFEADFKVTPGVLIPRPDTELIVEQAIKEINTLRKEDTSKTVLELGTGSGAIIVSLAKKVPGPLYFASDISLSALSVARENSKKIVENRVLFFAGSWFSPLRNNQRFDLILSNPPYIPFADIQDLAPEIQKFEPLLALDGGEDGLDCFRSILRDASSHLVPGGTLLLEMGFDQKESMEKLFSSCPAYESIEFIRDLAGHNRVVKVKKSID